MEKECFLIDVFTSIPFTGNQLAVFPSAGDLTTEQMQMLASEINYSETTFIVESPDAKADFNIRIFTPKAELPFAGHPTLGSAYAIYNLLDAFSAEKKLLKLRTKAGIIPLEKERDNIWMRQNEPEFLNTYQSKREIADLVGLKPDDISDELPVQEVSTGNGMLMLPIKQLSAIQNAVGNMNAITDFFENKPSIAPYLFTFEVENPASKVHTRLFAPHLGIIEDPATGSAAGPLTGYFLKYNIFGKAFEIQNEQGIEMGRSSQILMRGAIINDQYQIDIGGKCKYIGRSVFKL